jgi:hypothetical protein
MSQYSGPNLNGEKGRLKASASQQTERKSETFLNLEENSFFGVVLFLIKKR